MSPRKPLAALGLISLAGLLCWSCGGSNDDTDTGQLTTPLATSLFSAEPTPVLDPVLVGAGDISSCTQDNDELTAALIDNVVAGTGGEVVVFTTGDNVYDYGTTEEYEQCYHPTWGRHRERTRPAAGNHEYGTPNAEGYFAYFGAVAGNPAEGYYSYDLGAWHIVVLNTSDHCVSILCGPGSPQETWLRSDLESHASLCTLAVWHDPLFSSGRVHGSKRYVQPFWDALYESGAEIVVNGHEHNYERFGPQTPAGDADPDHGIREFVVGTGGESHYREGESLIANSEAADDDTYGVIKLTLHPSAYDWEFIPGEEATFRDSGSGTCHGRPPSH